ncbi:MAG TPA: hypothetical protein VN176_03500 [Verrucomicrobiae bacterium]|jgi:hypothetical protein|nr:hypothetical protein [Verrucomicrobiae bacterium]
MRGPTLVILLLGLCGTVPAQTLHFNLADRAVVLERVANAPATNEERRGRIRELFIQAGCSGPALMEQKGADAETSNIICRLTGDSDETIVVGAAYGHGASPAMDDWTAATMLSCLYQSLADRKRRHTLLFIAFASNGNVHAGSGFYAEHMSDHEVRRTEAVLNLNALGLSPTKVWTSQSNKDLLHSLVLVTYTLKLPLSQVDMQAPATTASAAFASRQIPQINVHSLTREDVAGGHAAVLRPDNYLDTYRLLSGYLAYLDATLKPRTQVK